LSNRLKAIQRDLAVSGFFGSQIDTALETLEVFDDIKEFGQRFFKGLNVQVYELMCGETLKTQLIVRT
jgi:hypothetical protein